MLYVSLPLLKGVNNTKYRKGKKFFLFCKTCLIFCRHFDRTKRVEKSCIQRPQQVFELKKSREYELRNIFVASCIETAARKTGCSTGDMYKRMKRVGFVSGYIIPGYDALHTQSRQHVTEDVLGALRNWEKAR